MNFNIAYKFALKNIKANTMLNIPFVLANGIMMMLFNITITLTTNKYVLSRNSALADILKYCAIVIGILTIVFALYSVLFLAKKRNKEIALYSVLGLEKKHVRSIINIENNILFSLIIFIGIVGGYIFGKLAFIFLNWVIKDLGASLMHYSFSKTATMSTLYISAAIMIIYTLVSAIKIQLLNPIQLFKEQHSGEGEPKVRVFVILLGIVALGIGYYIALKVEGVLASLFFFFIAVLFVILGTYMLYGTLSVLVLKLQKANKKYYYIPKNFLKISGILYRIKSNALSLASIAIASTGIIIGISCTAAIYNKTADFGTIPREYSLEISSVSKENIASEIDRLKGIVDNSLPEGSSAEKFIHQLAFLERAQMDGNKIIPVSKALPKAPMAIYGSDLESYNKITGKSIKLADDELLLSKNTNGRFEFDSIAIGNKKFKFKAVDNFTPSNIAVDALGIIAKDFETLDFINKSICNKNDTDPQVAIIMNWDVSNENYDTYINNLKNIAKNEEVKVNSQKEQLKIAYNFNGGIIFLGIMVSLAFLAGTTLILYYKQINAGYDDRDKIQSMKKIGLEDRLVKKTISSQIIWMFFMPLMVATIHSIFASRIVYKCLGLFGIFDYFEYAKMLIATVLIFFIVYFIIFKITSKTYYKLVA